MDRLAVLAPERHTAMFFDDQRHFANVNLLDDARFQGGGLQTVPTVGANVDGMAVRRSRESFGGKQGAFVFGMTGLAADVTFFLPGRQRRRGRLDDIGRGRLGGSRRVLACGSQLRFQTSDCRFQRVQLGTLLFQLRALLLHLRLQTLAVRTGISCCFRHGLVLENGPLIG
jgi:hypothetical protein